jgi:sulfite reductase alpha subunit-like flavoprotein
MTDVDEEKCRSEHPDEESPPLYYPKDEVSSEERERETTMPFSELVILYGGELAKDVAEQVASQKPAESPITVTLRCADERPKTLVNYGDTTAVCFILQTIENAAPTEDGGACVRFFKRKTHPIDLLVKFSFTMLGVGDSNLLLDRQTTGAADCNQVAQQLDTRLEALGGTRFHKTALADERTGLSEIVEPWIASVWESLASSP